MFCLCFEGQKSLSLYVSHMEHDTHFFSACFPTAHLNRLSESGPMVQLRFLEEVMKIEKGKIQIQKTLFIPMGNCFATVAPFKRRSKYK